MTKLSDFGGNFGQADAGAIISPDGKYRYRLWRRLRPSHGGGKVCVFLMYNPSTADASRDDPTIRRCRGFALREDCDTLIVVNLYAYRSKNPKDLQKAFMEDVIGPDNDKAIMDAAAEADVLICAWGAQKDVKERRDYVLCDLLADADRDIFCLGTTRYGEPRHPLYVPADQPLVIL